MTKRIYYNETYLDHLETTVVEEGSDERGFYLICTSTIFHPKGGGQADDQGSISFKEDSYPLLGLRSDANGIVYHYISKPPSFSLLNKNVVMKLDINHRLSGAASHTAGHLISDLVEQRHPELRGIKGSHLPVSGSIIFSNNKKEEMPMRETYAHYDLALLKTYLEEQTAHAIAEKKSIAISYKEGKRWIQIKGFPPCPCGGTHLLSLAELKGIEITKIKFKKKEGLKVSYTVF